MKKGKHKPERTHEEKCKNPSYTKSASGIVAGFAAFREKGQDPTGRPWQPLPSHRHGSRVSSRASAYAEREIASGSSIDLDEHAKSSPRAC